MDQTSDPHPRLRARVAFPGETFRDVPASIETIDGPIDLVIEIPSREQPAPASLAPEEPFGRCTLRVRIEGRPIIQTSEMLRAMGVQTTPAKMEEMVVAAIERMQRLVEPANSRQAFTFAEREALIEGGIDPDAKLDGADAIAETAAEYAALLATSLTTAQAGARLAVDPSRVRQRLTSDPPTLYGVRVHNQWRLPRFQFDGDGLVPGFEEVAKRLREGRHPLGVFTWFTTPDVDLPADETEETSLSPRDWLRTGRPVEPVARQAQFL